LVTAEQTVEASVLADIAEAEKNHKGASRSGLAAALLELARQMDAENSATSKSMCAKALFEGLDRLRALAPPKLEKNPLADIRSDLADELGARRKSRSSGS
jgi:hypothetical protein